MTIRCLIVDDSDCFLRSARSVLEREGVAVVGVATNSGDALDQMGQLKPDVMLLDICLGSESGFELARQVRESASTEEPDNHRPEIILISSYAREDFDELIAAHPVAGFLPKSTLSAGAIHQLLRSDGHTGSEQT
jgi:DNA-binding NarL/FixJ family response regulator